MSHVATCDLFITDLTSLAQACDELGLELMLGQTNYRWFGTWVKDYHGADAAYKNGIDPKDYGKCVHAIRLKGSTNSYEIGLVNRADGKPGYQLIWDFYGSGRNISQAIGQGGERLKDHYGSLVAIKRLATHGQRYSRVISKGQVVVTCQRS